MSVSAPDFLAADAIMAGGEFDEPIDFPSNRLDLLAASSPYNFVGGLEMVFGSTSHLGSAVVLSPNWALTAGHNVDMNDDGEVDDGLTAHLHLPGFGTYTSTSAMTYPGFTGFGNPTIHNDFALIYFDEPLPESLIFPALGLGMDIGEVVTLAGFGRSGFGSYGYTTSASLDNRRIGYNTIETFETAMDGVGELFRYTFHSPDQPASLGNDLESMLAPGDSGGPALVPFGDAHALVGVNTFAEGYGGRFGDIGGGVVLAPHWMWISETTGIALVPEPAHAALLAGFLIAVLAANRRRQV